MSRDNGLVESFLLEKVSACSTTGEVDGIRRAIV